MIAVVQLDGLGAEPTARLLAEGSLPNLGAVLAESQPARLLTPAPSFPAAVYPTLYGGVEPGRHGLFYPFQWSPPAQRVITADRLDRPPLIWERLSAAGLRTLVIDPYECPPRRGVAGERVVSGWQLRERVVMQRWSRPRSMWPAAVARHGLPPGGTETFGPRRDRELRALARALRVAPRRVAGLLASELRRRSFDLIWASLVSPHIGGHRLWGTRELDEVYRRVDEALGEILAALPAGARPIVVCPIGMEADSTRADLLPEMLDRVLSASAGAGRGDDSGAMWRLRAALPPGLRSAAAAALPAAAARRLTARMELRGVDWSHTRAFAHPSDNQGYVRINLRGRERDGIVDPADADALCEEIAAGLRQFEDPDGAPVVESIERTAAVERGERLSRLPDLVVRWRREGDPAVARSGRFGEVRRRGAGSGRTGNHPGDGAWVTLPGGGLDPRSRPRLVDVAATVAAWAGLDGAGLDGSPLETAVPASVAPPEGVGAPA